MTKAKLWDLLAATPLILLNVVTGAGIILAWTLQQKDTSNASGMTLELVSDATRVTFLVQLTILLMSRRVPENRARGPWPKVWALIGFLFPAVVAALPPAPHSLELRLASLALTLAGTMGSIYVAFHLGKSFSVFPQARGLVTSGPYKYVRHPLYFAETIASIGMSLQFAQPWALLLQVAAVLIQLPRMSYEEAVLAETYSGYEEYQAATARLVPGLY